MSTAEQIDAKIERLEKQRREAFAQAEDPIESSRS